MKKVLICVLCAIFFIGLNFKPTKVKADSSNREIYYITDNIDYLSIVDSVEESLSLTSGSISYYYWGSGPTFYSNFTTNYSIISNFDDALVIFEISNGFSTFAYHGSTYFVDELYDLFSNLKSNNCDILFISGTPEIRYENHNDFLDYVDFHIICGLLELFTLNVFYQIDLNCSTPPRECNLVINDAFLNFFGGYNSFKSSYLLPYINSRFSSYLGNLHTQAYALNAEDFSIYIEDEHNSGVYLINNGANAVLNSFLSLSFDPDYYNCFVMASNNNQTYNANWVTISNSNTPNTTFYFDKVNYIQNNFNFAQGVVVKPANPNNYPVPLETMMASFINDLSGCYIYDNVDGRCNITHWMCTFGPNGWMESLIDNPYFNNCFDLYDILEDQTLVYDDESLF